MDFSVVGLSYRLSPIALREKAAFSDSQKIETFEALAGLGVRQCVVLSTCNRSELYFIWQQEEQRQAVQDFYAARLPLQGRENLFCLSGRQAVEYLFRVSAGLDSMILGEDQILGQVAEAWALARGCGSCGKELGRIFQNAVAEAKALKTRLKISEQPLSLCYIGVRRVDALIGIQGKRALIVGSGKMAALALRYLAEYGAEEITACSRSETHARALTRESPGLQILPFSARYRAAAQSHLVISATASPHLIFQAEGLPPLEHPLCFLDLAIPRDVDPALARRPGLTLLDVDSLQAAAEQNLQRRRELARQGEALLSQGVEDTLRWLQASRVDEGIEALQQACGQIEADTLALLCDKLALDGHDAKLAAKILHAGMRRLQRQPIQTLKALTEAGQQATYTQVVTDLFEPPRPGQ